MQKAEQPRVETPNKMEYMPVPRLTLELSLPLMLSLLVQSLYNIVDSIFVSRISEDALTATSLAFPVQMLMIAFAVGTGVGVNALLSRTVGAKDYERAGKIAATGLLLSLLTSGAFILLGAFFTGWFASLFTADAAIAAMCKSYLTVCMLFCSGTFIETMSQRFLQATGKTLLSMLSLVVGAVVNIILDPILIFGLLGFPALGITGAAVATVIGQWLGAAVAMLLHVCKNKTVKLQLRGFRWNGRIVKSIYRVGLPTVATQAMGSLMVSAFNSILMPFSSTAVAFFGVYYKLQNFLFMPLNGLGQATIPLIGFNYGAMKKSRIEKTLKTVLPAAVVIALVGTALFCLLPKELLGLFKAGEDMLLLGVPAMRIISVTFAFSAVTMILGYALSGLGNGIVNMIATALRQLVLLVPAAYLFARFLGVQNVWYALWIGELAAFFYALVASKKVLRQKLSAMPDSQ